MLEAFPAKDKRNRHAFGKGFGYHQMFMVKASSYLAANVGLSRTFPMLSMDRAGVGAQVRTHQVEEHTGTGPAEQLLMRFPHT